MKTHTESTSATSHAYTIRMNGTLDGVTTRDPVGYSAYGQTYEPNVAVCMENVGKTEIVNPWIIVNGKYDWRSIDHVLDGILDAGMSEEEKARAIWEFARTHRYHYTCASDEVKDTVKMLNVYGYTLCWDEAYTVSNLWQAAGLKIRRGYPHGHCTTEVFYDGAYHLLDSDEHLLYLLRDNKTIASEEDLAHDRDLVKRGHAYGVLQAEDPEGAESASALFFFKGHRSGGRPQVGEHTMDLTLRPGEALIWEWEDRGKYHGYWDRPKRLSNGQMRYAPELGTVSGWADRSSGWVGDEQGLHLTTPETSALEVTVRSPYVIVGGSVDLTIKRSPGDTFEVSVTRDEGQNWHSVDVTDYSLDLDPIFPPDTPPSYAYTLRVSVRSNTPSDFLISHLTIETDLQMAPLSLPALELGDNQISYTSDNGGEVTITHSWEEQNAESAPQPPDLPVYPPNNGSVKGTQFTFEWPSIVGAVDYHFQLSDRADLEYMLSPVFEKLVSRTASKGKSEWPIPFEGLLNPSQTYYWRIRARSEQGQWGPWSKTWTFSPSAPGVPTAIGLTPNWDDRTLALQWQPGAVGNIPDHYEIYGSNERGFSVSRKPYQVVIDNDNSETFPPNLICTSDRTSLQIDGPQSETLAFYRVIAVDAAGTRSGPSDLAEAPRPMIVSLPQPTAVAGEPYTYQIETVSAMGELRAERVENRNYVRSFRESDVLRFLIDEGPPDWITIDEHTGLLTALPDPKHRGFHTVTVRVLNGQGGTDMQGFDLEVI